MALTFPPHLSYSAVSSYMECPERFRLSRGYHLDKETWYATLAGSAVHEITEALDRNRDFDAEVPVPTFEARFRELIAESEAAGVKVKASGPVRVKIGPTGGPNKRDVEWWLHWGPLYVQAWVDWRDDNRDLRIAVMPDGQPGIEVSIEAPMGGVPFRGFIDRVFLDGFDRYCVVDLKNGSAPETTTQLETYGVALRNQFGIEAEWAGYWMASAGELGLCVDLPLSNATAIESLFTMTQRSIRAGVFLPRQNRWCTSCAVKDYCHIARGAWADQIPIKDVVSITAPARASR